MFVFRLSVCREGLELESGVPVLLALTPGDCSDQKDAPTAAAVKDEKKENETSFIPLEPVRKFIPTPVVRIGNEAIKPKPPALEERKDKDNKNSIFYQWKPIKEDGRNDLESEEVESNRAFNTKSVRSRKQTKEETVVEIAEPVLRKSSGKNARAHNIDKPEITEPILGPTTAKNVGVTTKRPVLSEIRPERDNFEYYINQNEWTPSDRRHDGKNLKRHDNHDEKKPENPLRMIMMTVQFLPERFIRMFEQAEKYARETLFPLISERTPKFISNFIAPKEPKVHYVPLDFTESSTKVSRSAEEVTPKTDFSPPDVPISLIRTDPGVDNETATNTTEKNTSRSQKDSPETPKIPQIPPDSRVYYDETTPKPESTTTNLHIDLPVFDERDRGVKYIPLMYPDALKTSEKITRR